jgi:hypothetical protein
MIQNLHIYTVGREGNTERKLLGSAAADFFASSAFGSVLSSSGPCVCLDGLSVSGLKAPLNGS